MSTRTRPRTSRLLVLTLALGLAAVLAVASWSDPAHAQDDAGMKLEVLPKSLTKAEVKKIMKQWTRALGVECEFCHDMDDMAKDSAHKKVARKMVRMVSDLNDKQLKGFKEKVSCMTCHRGKKEPAEK
jgi:hypothetical protein